MDRTRCKRPSDVNEALSSMLWTPYDNVTETSKSTEKLTNDEYRTADKKYHRYSNPVTSSIHWSNTHVTYSQAMTMKYSFPNENCVPSDVSLHNFASATTIKQAVSKAMTERNFGQILNTSLFEPTIVRSFTEDFYHYQNQKHECQSTYKNYKSQPLIEPNSLAYPSSSTEIDKPFEAPSIASATKITEYYDDKLFNHQMVNKEGNKWRHRKVGNMEDVYLYVHKGSVKRQEKPYTNTTLYAEENLRKVTQPPNVVQSHSTLNSRNNKLSENEFTSREENCSQTQTKAISITSLSDSMVATSLASRSQDSNGCRVSPSITLKSFEMNVSQVPQTQNGVNSDQKMELTNSENIKSGNLKSMGNVDKGNRSHLSESGNEIKQCFENLHKIEKFDDCNQIERKKRGVESSQINSSRINLINDHDGMTPSDNVNSTGIVENILSDVFVKNRAHNKAKYSSDNFSLRENRRRNRRDRRQARVRISSTNEILPDIINNRLPPPYTDVPVQVTVPSINSTVPVEDNQYSFSLPLVRSSTSDRYGKDCCDQWFNGPPLRFLVALVALGGVACTLGGATLGSIALAGSPTSHLTAGLLMTGVGIVLVTISMVAWRMTTSENPQCAGRRQYTRGNSSFGLLYPEFQHRAPPPSYQNSIQQNRFREMMKNQERVSPPPTYRSNAGTLLSQPTSFSQNYAQLEAISDTSRTSANNVDTTSVKLPQTVKTIKLISRLYDNELDELILTSPDETSLIPKSSEINISKSSMIENCHKNVEFSCRCSKDISRESITNYNGDAVSTLDHKNHAYVRTVKMYMAEELIKQCYSSDDLRSACDPKTMSGRDCFVNIES